MESSISYIINSEKSSTIPWILINNYTKSLIKFITKKNGFITTRKLFANQELKQ